MGLPSFIQAILIVVENKTIRRKSVTLSFVQCVMRFMQGNITARSYYHLQNKANSAREGREAISIVGVDWWALAEWFDLKPMW